jgi:hypothetical protein
LGYQLRQVFIRGANYDLVHPGIMLETEGCGRQGIIGLEFHHRPNHDPQRGYCFFGERKLGEQVWMNAFAGLVA